MSVRRRQDYTRSVFLRGARLQAWLVGRYLPPGHRIWVFKFPRDAVDAPLLGRAGNSGAFSPLSPCREREGGFGDGRARAERCWGCLVG